MKSFIKAVLLASAVLLGANAYAQDKLFTFGVEAGMNLSNMSGDLKGDAKVGFNLGVTLDYALTPDLYLMSGLKFSTQGAKEDGAKISFSYLRLPVHVGYKLTAGMNTKVVLHAGPYIAYAVDGDYSMGGVSVDSFNKDIESVFGFKHNRFDMGLGLGIGLEFNKICVGLGYDFGLLDLVNVTNRSLLEETFGVSKLSGKNMNAYLTVGYKF